jgi:hypothetical protein
MRGLGSATFKHQDLHRDPGCDELKGLALRTPRTRPCLPAEARHSFVAAAHGIPAPPTEGQVPAAEPAAGTARTMNRCGAEPT